MIDCTAPTTTTLARASTTMPSLQTPPPPAASGDARLVLRVLVSISCLSITSPTSSSNRHSLALARSLMTVFALSSSSILQHGPQPSRLHVLVVLSRSFVLLLFLALDCNYGISTSYIRISSHDEHEISNYLFTRSVCTFFNLDQKCYILVRECNNEEIASRRSSITATVTQEYEHYAVTIRSHKCSMLCRALFSGFAVLLFSATTARSHSLQRKHPS